jgi:hypothetical protein
VRARVLRVALATVCALVMGAAVFHGIVSARGTVEFDTLIQPCGDPFVSVEIRNDWKHIDDDSTVRNFGGYTRNSNGQCSSPPDQAGFEFTRGDGWRMVVNNYTDATVYDSTGSQVYP